MAVFNAIEALQDLYPLLDAVYEEQMVRDRIKDQMRALRGLANDPRHDEAHLKRVPLTVDRVLAQHLITSTKSVARVIMQVRRPMTATARWLVARTPEPLHAPRP